MVKVYSIPQCPYCNDLKEKLTEDNIRSKILREEAEKKSRKLQESIMFSKDKDK